MRARNCEAQLDYFRGGSTMFLSRSQEHEHGHHEESRRLSSLKALVKDLEVADHSHSLPYQTRSTYHSISGRNWTMAYVGLSR